jgi:FKBP-type peptidyl-prolyl cis-trans isomerase FklB
MSINNIIAGSRKAASRFFLFFIAFVGIISMTSCRESNDTEDEFENWEARNKEYFNNIYSKAETAIKSGDDSWKIIRVYSKDSISAKSKSDFIVAHV